MIDEALLKKNILEILELDDLPPEQKKEVVEDLIAIVEDDVLARIGEAIPDDAKDELERLAETGDEKALEAFIEKHVGNIEQIIKEEAVNLKKEFTAALPS